MDGKRVVAHRWILGHLRGSPLIYPEELACHRKTCGGFKGCCNPSHLYVGTPTQNAVDAVQDGHHWGSANWSKTHCIRGHPFTEDNTHRFGPENRHRYCRTCKRIKSREAARKRRRKEKIIDQNQAP